MIGRGGRLAALAFAALLGLAMVGAPTAGGTRLVRFPSTVTIKIKPGQGAATFKGEIMSSNQACRSNRSVRLMQRMPGPDQKVSVTPTFGVHWRLGLDNPPAGEYYARVVKRSEGTAGTIYVCRPDSSRVVSYAP